MIKRLAMGAGALALATAGVFVVRYLRNRS
jgi:hypothetical protein